MVKRYILRYTNRAGDKLCKVIPAPTMFDAVAALPFGSKVKAVDLLAIPPTVGHSR